MGEIPRPFESFVGPQQSRIVELPPRGVFDLESEDTSPVTDQARPWSFVDTTPTKVLMTFFDLWCCVTLVTTKVPLSSYDPTTTVVSVRLSSRFREEGRTRLAEGGSQGLTVSSTHQSSQGRVVSSYIFPPRP